MFIPRWRVRLNWQVLGALLLLSSCISTFRISPKKIDNFFTTRDVEASRHSYRVGLREIHYVQAGDTAAPLVLFVHGSPGSLRDFIHFLTDSTLLERSLMISIDRPGFGHSNFGMGQPSLEKQAAALMPVLGKFRGNGRIILVGHSLGGPVIARIAMDYPQLVDGLIIVAGSIDPDLEPPETWFRAPLATPFLSWLLPRALRASNEEIYHLKPELEKMLPRWKEISCPVTVIHGKKDFMVPFGNVDFAKKMLVNAPVEVVAQDEMDHFVPWTHPSLIRDAVLKMIYARDSVNAKY